MAFNLKNDCDLGQTLISLEQALDELKARAKTSSRRLMYRLLIIVQWMVMRLIQWIYLLSKMSLR